MRRSEVFGGNCTCGPSAHSCDELSINQRQGLTSAGLKQVDGIVHSHRETEVKFFVAQHIFLEERRWRQTNPAIGEHHVDTLPQYDFATCLLFERLFKSNNGALHR